MNTLMALSALRLDAVSSEINESRSAMVASCSRDSFFRRSIILMSRVRRTLVARSCTATSVGLRPANSLSSESVGGGGGGAAGIPPAGVAGGGEAASAAAGSAVALTAAASGAGAGGGAGTNEAIAGRPAPPARIRSAE